MNKKVSYTTLHNTILIRAIASLGYTTGQIAKRLKLSKEHVESHKKNSGNIPNGAIVAFIKGGDLTRYLNRK